MRTGLSSRARTPATQPDARSLEVDRQLRDAAIRAAPGEHRVDPVAVGGRHDNPEQVAPRRADRIAGLRGGDDLLHQGAGRSEEHTSELRHANISYAVFCLK